jgi:hypothetical protein
LRFGKSIQRIKLVAEFVSELNNYDAVNYNCANYTNKCNEQYRQMGLSPRIAHIQVDCNSSIFNSPVCWNTTNLHAITYIKDYDLYVDCTGGFIIDNQTKYAYNFSSVEIFKEKEDG